MTRRDAVEGRDPTSGLAELPAIGEELEAGSLAPLSQGQRALWFLHHLAPTGGAYNIAAAARVLTPIGAATLERAVQVLVDRHAALRTTFPAVAGEPRARTAPHLAFLRTFVTFSRLDWHDLHS